MTEPTTSTQARTRIVCMGVGTLNQSTSRDSFKCVVVLKYLFYKHCAEMSLTRNRGIYALNEFISLIAIKSTMKCH